MKNFNWNLFKDNGIAVHCDTEEKANDFLRECHDMCMKWCNGGLLDYNHWKEYKENTCYCCNDLEISYSGLDYLKNRDYEIIEWDIEKKFTLNDIKPFYLVELMNDEMYLVCEIQIGIIFKNILKNQCFHIHCYNDKFENVVKEYNIKKVYGFSESNYSCLDSFKSDNRPLLWEREEEVKEMSLEEIENILGYKVKIVSHETL